MQPMVITTEYVDIPAGGPPKRMFVAAIGDR
jgi:hypothetical protein